MTTKLILDEEGIIALLKKYYESSDDVKLHIQKKKLKAMDQLSMKPQKFLPKSFSIQMMIV